MRDLKKLQAGYFLTFEIWKSAKKLLDYQIKNKAQYKIYNTFNFHYFSTKYTLTHKLGNKSYFQGRISNNLFYGLEREFFFCHYTVPKTGIGLRNFYFFSYPMQQLMYAFGIYLLKVSQQFLIDNKSTNIKSFYGGDLRFNTDQSELIVNSKTTLYYSHYHKFKKELVHEMANSDNKVFLRLDIQNYFDNISIANLLNLIEQNVKPSELTIHKFDSSTKEQIVFFYRFLSNGADNIPQSDNNIISNFISHLYLTFGDLIIEDAILKLNKELNIVKEFKIIRYVDDIYISIDFREMTFSELGYTKESRNCFIYQILNKIADKFYRILNLRFNGKAELFRIDQLDEKEKLLDLIKKVSEDYPEPESKKDITIDDKVNRLLKLIDTIKTRDISHVFKDLSKQESETLKDIYDKPVLELLSTTVNIARLESKFRNFNFDLLRVYPQPLIIMLTLCPNAIARLENYFLAKLSLTTFDRGLLVILLCQLNFRNSRLFEKLRADEQLKPIFEFMRFKKVVDNKNTGYYGVDLKKMKLLTRQVSYIEQIKQRVYSERQEHYSVALNHLLNEVQLACCILEGKNIKTYNERHVRTFLTAKGLDNSTKTKISNLSDRRNNNPVSHPGSDSRVAWAVEKTEYTDYKTYVAKTLQSITE